MIKFRKEVKPVWITGALVDFDNTEIGAFDLEERKSIKFNINPFLPGKARELRDKNTKKIFIDDVARMLSTHKGVNRSPQNKKAIEEALRLAGIGVREESDTEGYNHDVIDEVIVEWEGISNEEGIVIPCIRQNKIALFVDGGYTSIGLRLIDIAANLATRHELYESDKQRGEEKNLQSSQDGQPVDSVTSEMD